MFTISTGCGTRRAGGWMNESSSTRSRPPAAREHWSSSALIQRRAAPMPCVSESVRESVWRVWNEASLRMRASMRCADTAATIFSIWGLALHGSARATARTEPETMLQRIEISVDHRHDDEGQQRRSDNAADDRAAHRRLLLGALAQ